MFASVYAPVTGTFTLAWNFAGRNWFLLRAMVLSGEAD